MIYRQTYELGNDNRILVTLPEQFRNFKKVLVVVENTDDEKEKKLLLIQQAAKDPLFMTDISEVNEDFKHIDKENA
ncbi:MAG: hypothetical protein A2275_11570 [Bacteroidetes bacterium RIFOXYA12_FULL_35_11]|nr:MAG: hypothetical protein A2X01_18965 [Bacteroidetes bacterium GWF2_35_48]OFY72585.1 MAG: hypothetical protein A2275_11570 [Bacteroidetes bacterium RIFOXYA12_FULL_35_11]OFY95699.1 MAG: hypothetical protein A2491_08815 [Bacteroidetes bacterium RIFOXYC12_FULL_35_7]HBX49565.1 hypothetical protein [Bacteroidales bacterium]